MQARSITMLGTGLIGDFYTTTLHGQRGRDRVRVVYSRSAERGDGVQRALGHPRVDDRPRGGDRPPRDRRRRRRRCRTSSTRRPSGSPPTAGKAVLCTKPLGRTADEARRMLETVETAGVFGGYLEDLCYTPKTLKAIASVAGRRDRRRDLGPLARDASRAAFSAWFWDGRLTGGGAIIDLGCHCIEIIRNFVGKGNRPVEVMCHTDTLVHPIADEDNAIALIRFESGAIGQFEVSWTFRGGMDLRDEVAGTHGTIWLNHFLRTGFEMFTAGGGGGYVAEKAETAAGWLFPVGDEVVRARLRRHVQRHVPARSTAGARRRRRSTTATSSTRSWTPCYRSAKSARLGAGRAATGAAASTPRIAIDARDATRARSSSSARSCPTAATS